MYRMYITWSSNCQREFRSWVFWNPLDLAWLRYKVFSSYLLYKLNNPCYLCSFLLGSAPLDPRWLLAYVLGNKLPRHRHAHKMCGEGKGKVRSVLAIRHTTSILRRYSSKFLVYIVFGKVFTLRWNLHGLSKIVNFKFKPLKPLQLFYFRITKPDWAIFKETL